jgi:hypothetical protein
MPSIQQRHTVRAQTLLLAITFLFTFALALLPTTSPAHPGHAHGVANDGRIHGLPDFQRVGDTTTRFLPSKKIYKVTRPGEPPQFIHADPGPGLDDQTGGWVDLPTNELAPICRTNGNRIAVNYDGPDPVPTATIRSLVRRMNWKIADQSSKSSGGSRVVQMAVDCAPSGQISVYHYSKGTGFAGPDGAYAVKVLTFDATGKYGLGGGPLSIDNTKSRHNANAMYTSYPWMFDYQAIGWQSHNPMHELFHSMGATQGYNVTPKAPYSTGEKADGTNGHHCVDGWDVMCYEDGAGSDWGPYTETRCPASSGFNTPTLVPLDCGNDTYFDAVPTPGTYLANYWNVAGVENPFLARVPTQAVSASTEAASSVGGFGATLNGRVTPNGDFAFYQFQYGTDTSYESVAPPPPFGSRESEQLVVTDGTGVAAYGSNSFGVSYRLESGLRSGTTYHFRVVAKNDAGQLFYGADRAFTTLGARVSTGDASVNSGGAMNLSGVVNPMGAATTYRFEVSGSSFFGSTTAKSAGSGTVDVPVSDVITGLSASTTYRFRLRADSNGVTSFGDYKEFTTPAWKPGIVTDPATGVSGGEATLNGRVDPGPASATYWFEYVTDADWLSSDWSNAVKAPATPASLNANQGYIAVGEPIGDLTSETTYHYRIVASGADGTFHGQRQSFTMPAFTYPQVRTKDATQVSATKAMLNATVATGGYATNYGFEYGETTAYGGISEIKSIPAGTRGTNSVAIEVTGLKPNTTYHFHVGALGNGTVALGEDLTFRTAPKAITKSATNVSLTEATLNGLVNPEGLATTYQFEYGPTTSYGTKVPATPRSAGSGTADVAVSEPITDLTPHSTYHFRVVATNSNDTTYGEDLTFFTGAWSLQSTPNPPLQPTPINKSTLEGVSCPSSTLCLAAGIDNNTGKGFAQSWNGSSWRAEPELAELEARPKGIACPTTSTCLTVGYRPTGGGYTSEATISVWGFYGEWLPVDELTVPLPSGATTSWLHEVACSSSTACTAVGDYQKDGATKTLAIRLTSSGMWAWSPTLQSTPNPASNAQLIGVSCPTSSSCIAVGSKSSSETFIERWDGSSWTIQSTPSPSGATWTSLSSVSCTSATACTAVGAFNSDSVPRSPLALRWNGSSWTIQSTPTPGDSAGYAELNAVSCASATACTAVGSYATALSASRLPTQRKTLAMSGDGSGWALQSSPNPSGPALAWLNAVSCYASSACTAVGTATLSSSSGETATLAEGYG